MKRLSREQHSIIAVDTADRVRMLLSTNVRVRASVSNTKFYNGSVRNFRLADYPDHKESEIQVVNQDTLDCAFELHQTHNTLVLNMASDYKPGGGWLSGATAQEETLCKRSSLFYSLAPPHALRRPDWQYPFAEDSLWAIWSPDVVVVKDGEYKLLKNAWWTNVISMSAIRQPYLTAQDTTYKYDDDRVAMTKKIKNICQIALMNNHDAMVLGAFGCGVFGNPPEEVAEIFRTVLIDEGYAKKFRVVRFAILDLSTRTHNYSTFASKFGQAE